MTIASQAALGRWDQVERHMTSFLHMGGSKNELKEIAYHLALYCGFPAAVSSLQIINKLAPQEP